MGMGFYFIYILATFSSSELPLLKVKEVPLALIDFNPWHVSYSDVW